MLPKGWKIIALGEFLNFKNGLNADKESYGEGIKFVNVMDVLGHDFLSNEQVRGSMLANEKQQKEYSVRKGDILFNRTSETPNEIAMAAIYMDERPIIFGGFVIRGRQKTPVLVPEFAAYCLHSYNTRREIIRRGQGAVRGNIGQKDLSLVSVLVPPQEEQAKIAETVSNWDQVIERIEKLIAEKKRQKNALMQRLLMGKHRFPEFEGQEWTRHAFKEIFSPCKDINKDNLDYEVLSVTKDGIVSQSEYFKKEVASEDKSKYLIVKKDMLVMSGLNFWMGAIDFQKIRDVGIVSPAYKIFSVNKNKYDLGYLKHLVRSEIIRRLLIGASVQGASIVRRNLDSDMLMDSAILIPEKQEQEKIAAVLNAADKEIDLLAQKLKAYQEQKKGLMQQLLTGKKRVKLSSEKAA